MVWMCKSATPELKRVASALKSAEKGFLRHPGVAADVPPLLHLFHHQHLDGYAVGHQFKDGLFYLVVLIAASIKTTNSLFAEPHGFCARNTKTPPFSTLASANKAQFVLSAKSGQSPAGLLVK